MAFVDPNSTSGNLIPSAAIMKAFPGEEARWMICILWQNFQAVSFSGKHQAGLAAVVKGDVQVALSLMQFWLRSMRDVSAKMTLKLFSLLIRRSIGGSRQKRRKGKNFILSYDNAAYYKG